MKTKKTAIILGASLLIMTTTGCSHFESIMPPRLESLEITATEKNKSFVKGDQIFDCIDIDVSGWYTNGEEKAISSSDVEFFYTNDTTGEQYSIYTPIPEAGRYSVQARKGEFVSDRYRFSAVEERVYASSFALEEEIEQITIAPGTRYTFNLAVEPANYTEQIELVTGDSRIAWIHQLSRTKYEIVADKEGETRICFSVITSEKLTHYFIYVGIIVLPIYVDYMIPLNVPKKIQLMSKTTFGVDVSPINANVDIQCYAEKGRVEITKMVSRAFEMFATSMGEERITFVAKKSKGSYCVVSRDLTVTAAYVTSLSIESEFTIDRFKHRSIPLYYTPYGAYTSVTPQAYLYDSDILDVEFVTKLDYYFVYYFHTKKAGETDVTFRAKVSDDLWTTATTHVIVNEVYANRLDVTGPEVVNVGKTIKLNVKTEPYECATDVGVTIINPGVASVTRVTDHTFEVRGLQVGTTNLTFTAKTKTGPNLTKTIKLKVNKGLSRLCISQYARDLKFGIPATEPYGQTKRYMLVIPIWFTDSDNYVGKQSALDGAEAVVHNLKEKTYVYKNIEMAFFGNMGETKSVREYLYEMSHGLFDGEEAYSDWYKDKYAYSYYDGEISETGSKRDDLFDRAIDDYFRKHKDLSRKSFDRDGDGFIDYVAFVYAGPESKRGTTLACYMGWHPGAVGDVSKPVRDHYIFMSFEDIYRGRTSLPYTGAAKHESAHMFGARDYYTEAHDVDWVGSRTVMSSNGGMLDPYSLMSIGWDEPYIIKETTTVTIDDFESSRNFLLLTPKWNDYYSPFDEYMLLELYTTNTYNSTYFYGLSTPGIRLWHVDARLRDITNNFTNDAYVGVSYAFDNWYNDFSKSLLNNSNVSFIQTIRKDADVNTDNAITYVCDEELNNTQLFYEGDSFNFSDYRNQFWNYYAHKAEYIENHGEPKTEADKTKMENELKKYITLDNGKKFNFTFTIDKIVTNEDGTSSATITITKTA